MSIEGGFGVVEKSVEANNRIFQNVTGGTFIDSISVMESWQKEFKLREENLDNGQRGLRRPQVGALHALKAYWSTGRTEPVSIVLPTGTGKTDVMISAVAMSGLSPVLVLVPSDALRTQISGAFLNFGVLKRVCVVPESLEGLVVGVVNSGFRTIQVAEDFVNECNVVISTPNAIEASGETVRQGFLSQFSALFIDEAHHIAARTWSEIRRSFEGRPIIQFTATPFREDRKPLGGRIIYDFPLREAQKMGVFGQIRYYSVTDMMAPDQAIAEKAIEVLREDLKQGFTHILMARVSSIAKANKIVKLYHELAPELNPIMMHSKLSVDQRRNGERALRAHTSKIVVCVDMFGEGFDLPSLKIAAIHDPKKSVGVTLQFVGRFARTSGMNLGSASVIVSRQFGKMDEKLRSLYSETSDWNDIVANLSADATDIERETQEFLDGFTDTSIETSFETITPKMSTVVYRVAGDSWNPDGVLDVYEAERINTLPIPTHNNFNALWFILESKSPVDWAKESGLQDLSYELYIAYFNEESRLLFINSSSNDGFHKNLATALCPDGVERIDGAETLRAYNGIEQIVPTNIGTKDVMNIDRSHTMHTGAHVTYGLSEADKGSKSPTNLFAKGWQGGDRVTIGVSMRGRFWSFAPAPTIWHWIRWCEELGQKLTDSSREPQEILAGFIRPERATKRPELVAIGVDWPDILRVELGESTRVLMGEDEALLMDSDFKVRSYQREGPIEVTLETEHGDWDFDIVIGPNGMRISPVSNDVTVMTGRKSLPLSTYLESHGLSIAFEQDVRVDEHCMRMDLLVNRDPFDRATLRSDAWEGVNIKKESQGDNRDSTSIQYRSAEILRELDEWDFIIDDDGSGEVADLVAARTFEDTCRIMLVHCKYSSKETSGARVADLYDVCGQANKSAKWRITRSKMLEKLIRRERTRFESGRRSRFLVGSQDNLVDLAERINFVKNVHFDVVIVQPGMSKEKASAEQLELLASTSEFVRIRGNGTLSVYCGE